jgi:predicted ATP-dependent protease
MNLKKYEVPVKQLCWQCDPKQFEFECTKDLAPLREFIGQERAMKAVEFGLNMTNGGYNIYVAGLTGTGKTSIVKAYIERVIREKKARGERSELQDWCYLYNFKESDRPLIAAFPQGKGKSFQIKVTELLSSLKQDLGRTFSSDEYKNERQKTIEDGQLRQQKLFEEIGTEAHQQGFALQMTSAGPVLIPLSDNRPMSEQEYLALDDKTKSKLEERQGELRKKLRESLEKVSDIQQETSEKLGKADKDIGTYTVSRLFGNITREYKNVARAVQYLEDLKNYALDNLAIFKGTEETPNPIFGVSVNQAMAGRNPFLPFEVNVFVDNSETQDVPVIVETNPIFGNVFGKIERRFLFGGYLSDHTMLKPGAVSLANGGYLLLSARDVLANQGVWPALKRTIRNKEVRIEDPFEQFGLIAPQAMRPEPMPISVKIILLGDTMIYQVLATQDEDFWEIFKVKAEFDYEIDRTKQNLQEYAAFLSGCCEDCEARHFDPSGVAKIIEYSTRMVADQEKLSTRFASIKEWVEEANYWAQKDNAKFISARHVRKAIDEKFFRHNLPEAKIREMIQQGSIMIDVTGTQVGQINGLSVHTLGDITFGRPSRITARTFLGRGGIVNIEREADLSGPTHNKGVLILSGYLGSKYAQDTPLSLSASICFEQSYEGVDGDSASSAELYTILSSISGLPLKQNIAVTGSVNQLGEIQPIGGVNQKIEGFFRICQAKGLTGDQGVLIPYQNVRNLMLREEVVEAVKTGQFHVYSAHTIDDGIEILTGISAGERQADGNFPADSVNHIVKQNLKEMAEKLKGFSAEDKSGEKREHQ